MRRCWLHAGLSAAARRAAFQYEVVRRYVHFYFPGAPAWVRAGLVDYYATLQIDDDDDVFVGEPPSSIQRRSVTARRVLGRADPERPLRVTRIEDTPTMAELLGSSAESFWIPPSPDRSPDRWARVCGHKAASWALIHVLKDPGGPYVARFEEWSATPRTGATTPRSTTSWPGCRPVRAPPAPSTRWPASSPDAAGSTRPGHSRVVRSSPT